MLAPLVLAALLAGCGALEALLRATEHPHGGAVCLRLVYVWGLHSVEGCRTERPDTEAEVARERIRVRAH